MCSCFLKWPACGKFLANKLRVPAAHTTRVTEKRKDVLPQPSEREEQFIRENQNDERSDRPVIDLRIAGQAIQLKKQSLRNAT